MVITKMRFMALVLTGLMAAACNSEKGTPSQTGTAAQSGESPAGAMMPLAAPLSAQARWLTDSARFFAGLKVEAPGPFADLARTTVWKKFAGRMKSRWFQFQAAVPKMRDWTKRELGGIFDPAVPVFYPFSGPDFTFADVFLPGAKTYVFVGLESVGSIPRCEASTDEDLKTELSLYEKALDDLPVLSFFRSNDMKEELTVPSLDGVVPIIMLLLAGRGKEIISVASGSLDAQGEFVDGTNAPALKKTVARIVFRSAGQPAEQTLTYLSVDLSNGGGMKNASFVKFLDGNVRPCFTFVKSASYLMHKSFFSAIRTRIFDTSYAILQDDSAIGYQYFDPSVWTITLYGAYAGPVKLFKDDFEQDLFDAYKVKANVKPLGFRFGYAPRSNILLAVKKTR